jgi:hypothetical protein
MEVMMYIDDQVLIIWKRRKRKTKMGSRGKGISNRAIFVLHSRHHRGFE